MKDKSESFPYLAGLMADFLTYDFEVLAKKLDWGADQKREKKVKDIRLIRKEAKERIRIAKEAEYQLEYLKQIYPEIEEIVDCSYDDIKDMSSIEEFKENYDYTASYLSKKEYDELDSKERNQLALSVGYNLYQKSSDKCSVRYFGNEKRLEDLGRDLIVESHNVIKIVQCKYWSRSKEIHEKHIFQLYGTAVSYKLDNDCEGKEVVPVFVTNVTALAYRLISPSSCKSGIPVLDTLTLLMHSGSVYQKAYASPGTLYCPPMIFILLLNSISFSVLPSANVIPFP